MWSEGSACWLLAGCMATVSIDFVICIWTRRKSVERPAGTDGVVGGGNTSSVVWYSWDVGVGWDVGICGREVEGKEVVLMPMCHGS